MFDPYKLIDGPFAAKLVIDVRNAPVEFKTNEYAIKDALRIYLHSAFTKSGRSHSEKTLEILRDLDDLVFSSETIPSAEYVLCHVVSYNWPTLMAEIGSMWLSDIYFSKVDNDENLNEDFLRYNVDLYEFYMRFRNVIRLQ